MYQRIFIKYLVWVLISLLFFGQNLYAGPIYVYKQSDGVIRFSSKPPPKGLDAKVFEAHKKNFSLYRGKSRNRRSRLFKKKYWGTIQTVAFRHNISPHLVQAIIHVESAFNTKAVSPKGALGLMQIMPFNLKKLGVTSPHDPKDNISGGVKLISTLLKKYKYNTKLALAAYNAGEGAVEKYRGIPPYNETRNYVRKVLEFKKMYSL